MGGVGVSLTAVHLPWRRMDVNAQANSKIMHFCPICGSSQWKFKDRQGEDRCLGCVFRELEDLQRRNKALARERETALCRARTIEKEKQAALRQVDLLQDENRTLKARLDTLITPAKMLKEHNEDLKRRKK